MSRQGAECCNDVLSFDLLCRRKASADKELAPIIEESRKKAGLFKGQPPKLTPEEIIQFIFFPVVNEGCRVIDEGIVDKPSDLDVATVMSMGFPAYRYLLCLAVSLSIQCLPALNCTYGNAVTVD